MNEITELTVTQIRIFPVGVIPFSLINTKSCAEKVKEMFGTTALDARGLIGKDAVAFVKGEYKKDAKLLVIRRIEIDPRRIIVEAEGASEDCDAVYEAFVSAITSISDLSIEQFRNPLLKAETSQCVAKLNFEFDAIFSGNFTRFLNRNVEKEASSTLAKAQVRPVVAVSEIAYEIVDRILFDNKITLNPKQFSIAVLPGAPSAEKKYIVSSPFNSQVHIKLIKELDRILTKAKLGR